MALPDYLQETAKDYAKQLTATTSVPIQTGTFTGRQFVAGEDPLQTQAINLATQGIGSYQPFLTSAQQAITQAGQDVAGLSPFMGAGAGTGAGSIASFMSPYQQGVIDETLRQFDQSRVSGRRDIQDAAVQAGAFGGGREGALLGQYDADSLANRTGLQAQLLQQGFQNAQLARQNAFNQQQALAQQQSQLAQLAPSLQGQQIAGLTTLGSQQQARAQAGLTAQQALAQAQQQQPLTAAQTLGSGIMGLISGYPAATQTQQIPSISPLQSALGIGSTLAGIYRLTR